jgi:cytochrome b6-f complex iron-sulfur subunit
MSGQGEVSRRTVLKALWGAAGALAVGEVVGVSLTFFSPNSGEGEFGGVITAGQVDDFPPGSVTPFNEGRFYLVRLPDSGFIALYRKCTHLGCAVPWDPAQGQFVCPCHGSAFEMEGEVLNPPAPRPLDMFAIEIVDGMVKVDTGTPVERDTPDPSQLVYA